jgi:hypothetical protein
MGMKCACYQRHLIVERRGDESTWRRDRLPETGSGQERPGEFGNGVYRRMDRTVV